EELRHQAQGNELLTLSLGDADRNEAFSALQELPSVASVDFSGENGAMYQIQSKEEQQSAKAIFDLCIQKGWYINQLTPVETKLEDIFREVTQN
ncbi:MAG: DUF4162 domain-containing protein, partial [Draconibacterium sp.]|nr:DUF4162 domain-containing protein [Draconibacterium sp.]